MIAYNGRKTMAVQYVSLDKCMHQIATGVLY
jgi:hypothetical protein